MNYDDLKQHQAPGVLQHKSYLSPRDRIFIFDTECARVENCPLEWYSFDFKPALEEDGEPFASLVTKNSDEKKKRHGFRITVTYDDIKTEGEPKERPSESGSLESGIEFELGKIERRLKTTKVTLIWKILLRTIPSPEPERGHGPSNETVQIVVEPYDQYGCPPNLSADSESR